MSKEADDIVSHYTTRSESEDRWPFTDAYPQVQNPPLQARLEKEL